MFKRIIGGRVLVKGLSDDAVKKLEKDGFDSMLNAGEIVDSSNHGDLNVGDIILFKEGESVAYGEDFYGIVNYSDIYAVL